MLAGTVPFVLFCGVNVNPTPLHTVVPIVVIDGVGFTVNATLPMTEQLLLVVTVTV